MKNPLTIIFFVCNLTIFGQNVDGIGYQIIEKKLNSDYFQNERKVKIFLPKDYSETKKYPVIYTLDGFELFPITSSYTNFLMQYDVIPKSIVVSIFHNDRNYETNPNYGQNANIPKTEFLEGSEKLKNHLINEVKPLIEKEYSTSNYNVIVGHSNTATFVNEMISKEYNPFQAFIAISPDLADEQIDFLKEFISIKGIEKFSYFVSSGLKDDQYRLETGKRLDTIFKMNNYNDLFQHKIYNAGHRDLVPKSLNDALMFVFSDYRNFDDFETTSRTTNFSVKDYLKKKVENTNNTYGISSTLNEDDYLYLIEQITNVNNRLLLDQILEVGKENNFYPGNHLYSDRAQWYEQAGFYEEAINNWKLQLENGFYENTFYFERPFRLFNEKLNRPKEGIEFLKTSMDKYPDGKLVFNYWIAKTILDNDLKRKDGIKAIDYCIKNFKENKKFSLHDAKKIQLELLKNK
ncbi:alpha/beta hydrolase [Galbibacter mesophilus]|uniref:alpha/beta hydrolase n=1 Tax=Galbibacter mesophilus TaxID=379069 RepID=UPI00191F5EAB|nr:alpha/beta hydrolase-fold protein [Galbibacter mesophilus]MCM5662116.1 alpha/beta hydrolase-fold protein [Galbibacter mesophilus]